jgi:hypothetical protein
VCQTSAWRQHALPLMTDSNNSQSCR